MCPRRGRRRRPRFRSSVLHRCRRQPTFAPRGHRRRPPLSGSLRSQLALQQEAGHRGFGAMVSAETRANTGTQGPECCEMGSCCVDFNQHWSCRHGPPRRISRWLSRGSPSSKMWHLWILGNSPNSEKKQRCRSSEERYRDDEMSRRHFVEQMCLSGANVVLSCRTQRHEHTLIRKLRW